jgi:hypothetical protein
LLPRKRYQLEDEPIDDLPDPRLKQIQGVRANRLSRLEREKQQAQEALDQSYQDLANARPMHGQNLWRVMVLEPILEDYYLSQDVYMHNLRRWMDQTQALKPMIDNIGAEQKTTLDACVGAQKNLDEKTKEVQMLMLQVEKLKLLQENWST